MKKIIALCMCVALLSGCKKAGNSCASPNFTASADNIGDITIYTQGSYGFVKAEYGSNGYTRGTGTQVTLSSTGGLITGLANGTYDVYLQGNCGGTSNSDWAGPKSVLVTSGTGNCSAPMQLSVTKVSNTAYATWDFYPSNNLFEVEFGPTGFTIGHGDTALVNSSSYSNGNITYGVTYDFIVRAKCTDGSWSAWSSRFSYYCDFNNNVCAAPSNILSSVTGSNVNLYWDANGMGQWEYGISTSNTVPSSIAVASTNQVAYGNLTSGTTYYFYVRGICNGGTRTNWAFQSFQD